MLLEDHEGPLGHYKGLQFFEIQDALNLIPTFYRDILFSYAAPDCYEMIPIFNGFGNTTNNNNNNNTYNNNQNRNIDNNDQDDNDNNNSSGNSNTNCIIYHKYITYDQLMNLGENESQDIELERWNQQIS